MIRPGRAKRIERHRSYEISEAAEFLGVTPQTVRGWTKQGLTIIDDRRPHLILGEAIKDFLESRETTRRRSLGLGHFYCLRCKAPTTSALGWADYVPQTATTGRLQTFCARCEGPCGRVVSRADLPRWAGILEIGGNVAPHP
jgi:hypothetical protein